jgi:uncharacterized protein (DUF488 family)
VNEFIDLLKGAQIALRVDVRSVSRSRTNPQYNCDILPETLARSAIAYEHMAALGGFARQTGRSAGRQCVLAKPELSRLCRLCAHPTLPIQSRSVARVGT